MFKSLSAYSNRVFSNQQHLIYEYENILQNSETIQSYNSYKDELQYLEDREKYYEKERVRLVFYIDVVKFSFTIIVFVYMLSIFFYFYSLMMRDKTLYPPWKFITFITILFFFVVRFILCLMTHYQKTIQVTGSIQELSKIPLGFDSSAFPADVKFKTYNIEIKNVTFSYPNKPEKIILKNFNMSIPYRSNILIKGKIGSGKSTIGRLLCGWYKVNDGEITIDGKNVNIMSLRNLKSIIFYD